ncbi:cystathionine beta-lyase [Pararobbsia silviterrae]|uniref:Cystathionine beta-lyase n=1 Tax=Pararobbsia silviterrae TaxID=1792498 RepID=A0A494XW25_9BURK|nr:cystathionine beta-lyase [Pararobbsia silviterrae]RKP54813.1 cystathionine beta-lyase [Pararobbsia silviterrae]
MSEAGPKIHPQTLSVHPEDRITPGWNAVQVPVARASTILFPDLASMRALNWRDDSQWRYGLHATPTSMALQQRLAALEGGQYTLLHPSGLSSITNVYLAFVRPGDDVLIPDNVYSPNRDLGDWYARDFGVSVRYYDPLIGERIADLIQPNTKLIWIEAPGSVTMEVPDVPAIARVARAKGVVTAIDSTYAAGIAFRPLEHGIDIVVQALTKYQSGGSDVMMGATITRDSALHTELKRARMLFGIGVSADDCALVLRSLPTMQLRYEAHDRSALSLATWLATRPEVEAVLHPALPSCPGHAHFARDFTGAGGLFSIVLNARYTSAQVDAFVEGLRFFKLGWSWGGALSLALPYDIRSMRTATSWPYDGVLVRFFVGLEDTRDLRDDIERSLTQHLAG